jgi:hypothetical protein
MKNTKNQEKKYINAYIMAFRLCKYKNAFGEPRAGLRKYRIFNIAIMDTVVVIIIGYFISIFMKWPLLNVLAVLFISGIIIHRMFCVRTGIDKIVFPNI